MLVILPSSSALHSCAYLLLSLSIPLIRGLPFSLHLDAGYIVRTLVVLTVLSLSLLLILLLFTVGFPDEFESFDGPLTVLITSKNYHGTRLSINLGTSVLIPAPN